MARIAGINIPNHQHTEIGLTAIYGVGRQRARDICDAAGVQYSKKVKDLTDDELEVQHGRGPAPGDFHEYQAAHGSRLLSRVTPPSWSSCSRAAHPHECTYP